MTSNIDIEIELKGDINKLFDKKPCNKEKKGKAELANVFSGEDFKL